MSFEVDAAEYERTVLTAAISQSRDMIFIAAADDRSNLRITYANESLQVELGYDPGELIGRSPNVAYGPLTNRETIAEIWAGVQSGTEAGGELLCYRKDGTTFWSEWHGRPIADAANKRYTWVAIGRNTDLRRRHEDSLARLSAAVESASDAIYIYSIREHDTLPMLRYLNAAASAQSGIRMTDPDAQRRRFGPETQTITIEEIVPMMRRGESWHQRMKLVRRDGSTYWADINLKPLKDRSGNFTQWIAIERDVSREVERELRLKDLMSMIAHDIRGPLTGLLGFGQLFSAGLIEDAEIPSAIRTMVNAGRRLEALADELSMFARLEQGDYRPACEPLDARTMLDDIRCYLPGGERIDLDVTGDRHIHCDRVALHHIVENLFGNALKYSSPATRVTARATCDAGGFTLRVSDRGIGIPSADLPFVFERSSRASNAGTIAGSGLGLSFVKRLVSACDGEITVESGVGSGSAFTLRLPSA